MGGLNIKSAAPSNATSPSAAGGPVAAAVAHLSALSMPAEAAAPLLELNPQVLAPIAQNLGQQAGAVAAEHLSQAIQNGRITINITPEVAAQFKNGFKEFGEAGAEKIAAAAKDIKLQVPVTHNLTISAGTAATVIGALILAKSIYDGLWGEEHPLTQSSLKEASSNAQQPQDASIKKNILDFVYKNRNIIGGTVGLLLMCNQQILGLFSGK